MTKKKKYRLDEICYRKQGLTVKIGALLPTEFSATDNKEKTTSQNQYTPPSARDSKTFEHGGRTRVFFQRCEKCNGEFEMRLITIIRSRCMLKN